MYIHHLTATLLAVIFLAGCSATRPINERITQVDPDSGYRGKVLFAKRENNDKSTLFILSFSGGGTRAAAFSYGVLNELNRVMITVDGQQRRLIDEVDAITGVSGGSFTALAYALHGENLFSEYEQRFLKRDVQGELFRRTINPFNWNELMSGTYGRSEMAAEYYDEILFENATFADLMTKQGPMAIATGTDISTGSRLAFYQGDFDLLCTDLGPVHLSRAAATSSAVPAVLSPVTLTNYGGTCGLPDPVWAEDLLSIEEHLRPAGRTVQRYKEMQEFQDGANRPFIHLVDGGVSDNIGVRAVLEIFEQFGMSEEFRRDRGMDQIRRVVLIVVNAKSGIDADWEKHESPPGTFSQLMQSTGVPIERYSFETVELLKDRVAVSAMRRNLKVAEARLTGATQEEAEAQFPKIDLHVLDVSFDAIRDPERREYFMHLPTSFSLPEEAVDSLRDVAGELLRQSPLYQQLLVEFNAEVAQ